MVGTSNKSDPGMAVEHMVKYHRGTGFQAP